MTAFLDLLKLHLCIVEFFLISSLIHVDIFLSVIILGGMQTMMMIVTWRLILMTSWGKKKGGKWISYLYIIIAHVFRVFLQFCRSTLVNHRDVPFPPRKICIRSYFVFSIRIWRLSRLFCSIRWMVCVFVGLISLLICIIVSCTLVQKLLERRMKKNFVR